MMDITLGPTEWRIELDPERSTIILTVRGPIPRNYALHLVNPTAEHNSEQTPRDQLPNDVEVAATAHVSEERQHSSQLGHVDVRNVVLTPIECNIQETLSLVLALLSHLPARELPSPLNVEVVRNWLRQIEAAIGELDD